MSAHRPLEDDGENERAHLRDVRLLIESREARRGRHREAEFLPQHFAIALQHLEARAEDAVGEHDAAVIGEQHVRRVDRAVRQPTGPCVERRDRVDDERGQLQDRRFGDDFARRFEMRKQFGEADAAGGISLMTCTAEPVRSTRRTGANERMSRSA